MVASLLKNYIKSKRLKISYNTALDYAKIGEALIKYQFDLDSTGFSEAHGLKKLLFLERALKNHDEKDVFDQLKQDSFKGFLNYSKPARAGFAQKLTDQPPDKLKGTHSPDNFRQWIFEDNGKLYLKTSNKNLEILTFNKKLLESKDTSDLYKHFIADVIVTAMNNFITKQMILPKTE